MMRLLLCTDPKRKNLTLVVEFGVLLSSCWLPLLKCSVAGSYSSQERPM